jgi:putative SOS response-associated peptidase YedK
MCGRYSLIRPLDEVAIRFLIDMQAFGSLPPRPNIAPTEPLLAVRLSPGHERHAAWLRWGLSPPWAGLADPRPINARGETAAERPMFRSALRLRRALLPADAFYEWRRAGRARQPVRFSLRDGGLFALAALWERRTTPEGPLETACILTAQPNALVAEVHDRMPVILRPEDEDAWLDPDSPASRIAQLLVPYPAEGMSAHEVPPLRRAGPLAVLPPA